MAVKIGAIEKLGFRELKRLIAPFREICSATLEGNIVPRISHILTSWIPANFSHTSIPIFTMFPGTVDASLDPLTEATLALPPGVSPLLLQAYSKWNMCDISVFTFLPHIRDALAPYGARVEWVITRPRALHILHWSWNPNALELMNHSVFLITTKQGKQYVADFTQEQFGYYDNWLMTKNEYLRDRTSTGVYRITGQLDLDTITTSCDLIESVGRTADLLRETYAQFDWSVLDGTRPEQLAARVRLGVAEVLAKITMILPR